MAIVKNLTVLIKKQKLLDNISCLLVEGRITNFIGKSGAGKTTLLKSLAGLISASSGSITINNKQLDTLTPRQRAEEVGYVFQDFNLFPQLTVLQNCIDPLRVHGKAYTQARQIALTHLQSLEMDTFLDRYPRQLSGGQQQRVSIARALCLNPRILLLDEPTASLDPANTNILVGILQKLANDGLTIALSSQDMSFVSQLLDRAYFLESGTIVECCESKEQLHSFPNLTAWLS